MHTIWIVPGRFGITFGPNLTGSLNEIGVVANTKTILRQVWTKIVTWHQRSRQRRHLSELSDDMLKDIGLTHEIQRMEIAKRFWQ